MNSLCTIMSQQGLKPIKLAYHPTVARWLDQLTESTFNWLGWYARVLVTVKGLLLCKTGCFSPISGHNHRQYLLHLHTRTWPGWVSLDGWLNTNRVCPHGVTHLCTHHAQCKVTSLMHTVPLLTSCSVTVTVLTCNNFTDYSWMLNNNQKGAPQEIYKAERKLQKPFSHGEKSHSAAKMLQLWQVWQKWKWTRVKIIDTEMIYITIYVSSSTRECWCWYLLTLDK